MNIIKSIGCGSSCIIYVASYNGNQYLLHEDSGKDRYNGELTSMVAVSGHSLPPF